MDNQNVVTTETVTNGTAPVATVSAQSTTINTSVAEPKQEAPKQPEKPKADSAEVEKLKAALNKACAEASEYKKALREKQTEQERAEAERAEADKAMREELETLRREKSISDYTNRCVTLGFEAELAAETAHALADGNMETMFDCLKQFVETTKTKLANDALNRQPSLSAGTPPTSNTVDTETEQLRRWMGAPTYRK